MRRSRAIVCSASLLLLGSVLTACSGGGGGSGSPTPTPTPTPTPLSISVKFESTSIPEGQAVDIVDDGSTWPLGARRWELTQVSGPQVSIHGNQPPWTISLPQVDMDSTFTMRATLFVDNASDSTDISATITDVSYGPATMQWSSVIDRLVSGSPFQFSEDDVRDRTFMVMGNAGHPVGYAFAEIETDPSKGLSLISRHQIESGSSIPHETPVVISDFNLDGEPEPAIVKYSSNTIEVFRQTADATDGVTLEEAGTGSFPDDICALIPTLVGDDRPAAGQTEYPGLLVGSPNDGLYIFKNSGNVASGEPGIFSGTDMITTTGEYCGFAVGHFNNAEPARIYAHERGQSEIVPIDIPITSTPVFGNPISLSRNNGRDAVVDMQFGKGQGGQNFLAVLLSGDGNGYKNFLEIIQGEDGSQRQTIELPQGYITDLFVGNIDHDSNDPNVPDMDDDILIPLPENDYVYVLENLSTTSSAGVSFSAASYLKTELFPTRVTTVTGDGEGGRELLVADHGPEIILYQNED